MTDTKLADVYGRLTEPFPPEKHHFLTGAIAKGKGKALVSTYIQSRDVMDRLDLVVGPDNWTFWVQIMDNGATVGHLKVLGVEKSDVGFRSGDDDAGIKGSASDALKRAAVLFGIGRYLYDLPKVWVDYDVERKRITTPPEEIRAQVFGKSAPRQRRAAAPQPERPSLVEQAKAEGLVEAPAEDVPPWEQPEPEEQEAPPKCPKHGKRRKQNNVYYCPSKDEDGKWCEWKESV